MTAANVFFLQDRIGVGPTLAYDGADVSTGQFGPWAPIAAEATGNGYEVAWKFGNADQYTVWRTDANGNYTGNVVGVVAGSDTRLQSAEPLFQQDLNGDGRIGLPPAMPIESNGATTLALTGSQFYLLDGASNGPTLKFQGADFAPGQFGPWTPIGAEATGNGYEVAWHYGSADQYTVWNTNANGDYVGNVIGAVSGSDPGLLAAESFFQQDLNSNGHLGL
jgi:hypothetical protein